MTVGKYVVVNPNEGSPVPDSHKLTVRVTLPYGSNYHYGDHVESGNFAFTAAETGDYSACFWVSDHKPSTTVTTDFDWKTGVVAKDWSNVAKKGQIEVVQGAASKAAQMHQFDSILSMSPSILSSSSLSSLVSAIDNLSSKSDELSEIVELSSLSCSRLS